MLRSSELDDAKRELELTVEKRVQDGLLATREQAKKEAEEGVAQLDVAMRIRRRLVRCGKMFRRQASRT